VHGKYSSWLGLGKVAHFFIPWKLAWLGYMSHKKLSTSYMCKQCGVTWRNEIILQNPAYDTSCMYLNTCTCTSLTLQSLQGTCV